MNARDKAASTPGDNPPFCDYCDRSIVATVWDRYGCFAFCSHACREAADR